MKRGVKTSEGSASPPTAQTAGMASKMHFYFTKVPHAAKKVNKSLCVLYKTSAFGYNR
jgi:hypothetical protein